MRKITTIANVRNRKYSEPKVLTSGAETFCLYLENGHPIISVFKNGILENTIRIPIKRVCYLLDFILKDDIFYIVFARNNNKVGNVSFNFKKDKLFKFGLVDLKINCKNLEDLRIAVDNDTNVHITFTAWKTSGAVIQNYIGKYPSGIENKIFDGRGKHGDIAVDGDKVFLVWQKKEKNGYIIALQDKDKYNNWGQILEVAGKEHNGLVQRPRIAIKNNIIHVIYQVGEDPNRHVYYVHSRDNFKRKFLLTEKEAGYGSLDISVFDGINILITMRKNREILMNRMINGRWMGVEVLLKDKPVTQACFLDKQKFSVIYSSNKISKESNDCREIKLLQQGDLEYKDIESESEVENIPKPPQPKPEPKPERKIDNKKIREGVKRMKIDVAKNDNKFLTFVKKYIKEIGSFIVGSILGGLLF